MAWNVLAAEDFMIARPETTIDQSCFVEQAEYLEPGRFEEWVIDHPDEKSILQKLTQSGAKLITGPRGCGKTTLLLKAYRKLLEVQSTMPVYVNFKGSLRLEPLYKDSAKAVYWFNQWLIMKVYQGLFATLRELGVTPPTDLAVGPDTADRMAGRLELGDIDLEEESAPLYIPALERDVDQILKRLGRKRCVLLLDDAAHAFSTDQQRDFFDFLRQVKSRTIAPKAAIYPGVTTYSSAFNVGHDAEEVDVWIKPDDQRYVTFMIALLEKRLPHDVLSRLMADRDSLLLVCYASFGMPRSLLNMVRTFYVAEDQETNTHYTVDFSRPRVAQAIRDVYENTVGVFASLQIKLPMYSTFIQTGQQVYDRMIDLIKAYNKGKAAGRLSVTIAIQRPLPPEFQRLMGFFQYSGLIMPQRDVSRGVKGTFALYAIHYAALIERNALLARKSVGIAALAQGFEKRSRHEFTRTNYGRLLGEVKVADAFPLSLPPCEVCKTPRVNESAKFCLNCGNQLKGVSVFESLVNQSIDQLPLTAARLRRIKENSKVRTIKDILIDSENRELRGVPWIGPVWAKRILAYAEEFIA